MAVFPLHALPAACLLAGNVFSVTLRTCYIRYILVFASLPIEARGGEPCNGPVWVALKLASIVLTIALQKMGFIPQFREMP